MPDYQTFLFDLDGTLTDPKPGLTRSVQYALSHLGIDVPDLETLTPFIGPPLAESFSRIYNFSADQTQQAIKYYRDYFAETGLYENAVYPEIPELLATLQGRGKHLAVATSKPMYFAQIILNHFHLAEYFDLVVGSEMDGTRSNKAEVIEFALSKLPEETTRTVLMIGDRMHDILGARKNHLESVAVAYGYGTTEELLGVFPTYLVQTVTDLATLLCSDTPESSPFRQQYTNQKGQSCK
jgi:phosphoglycolate phosphatase